MCLRCAGTDAQKDKKKSKAAEKADTDDEALPIKTTLIVVPANLRQQWADEIKHHLQPGAITWYDSCSEHNTIDMY